MSNIQGVVTCRGGGCFLSDDGNNDKNYSKALEGNDGVGGGGEMIARQPRQVVGPGTLPGYHRLREGGVRLCLPGLSVGPTRLRWLNLWHVGECDWTTEPRTIF